MVVPDASVLIALAKIRRLDLLRCTYGGCLLGPIVFEEVVTAGKRIQALGVEQVEQAVAEGWVQAVRLTAAERRWAAGFLRTSSLHRGEAEALAIARDRGLLLVVDDKAARGAAEALGIDFVGTAGVLLESFYLGQIDLDGLEQVLVELAGVIWLSPQVVANVLILAREGGR